MVALYLSASAFATLAATVFSPEHPPPVWVPVAISLVTLVVAGAVFLRGWRLRLASVGWLSGFLLVVLLVIASGASNLMRATIAGILMVGVLVMFAWLMPTWAGRVFGYSALVLYSLALFRRYPTTEAVFAAVTLTCLAVLLTELLGRFKRDMQQTSMTDHLCGVWNRRGFDLLLEAEIRTVARTGESLTLIFIDLDDFKSVNDTLGHHEGDLALQRVSGALVENLRSGDSVARVGGDEFLLLLPRTDADEAESLAKRLQGEVTACGWSYGIAEYKHHETAHELIERCDAIMMQQKRGRGHRHDPISR